MKGSREPHGIGQAHLIAKGPGRSPLAPTKTATVWWFVRESPPASFGGISTHHSSLPQIIAIITPFRLSMPPEKQNYSEMIAEL